MSTRFRAAFAVAAFAAASFVPALSFAQAQNVQGVENVENVENRAGLILDTEPPGMFLLYSGDVIGYIEPCG